MLRRQNSGRESGTCNLAKLRPYLAGLALVFAVAIGGQISASQSAAPQAATNQAAGTNQASANQAAGTNDDEIVKDFESRVASYLQQRKKQAGTSPRATNSSEKLDQAHQALSQKSKMSREEARQGDIFAPRIVDYFRRQVAATLAGPRGSRIRASLRHAEPVQGLTLRVNQVYPRALPLQSTPPTLLLNLPPLPKELQYRIVGRNLVLLDVAPKLIVDFVPDAIPPKKD